jgi:peptidoglycan/xylan/chitin deacetylase (PgdA/CDA1 family)
MISRRTLDHRSIEGAAEDGSPYRSRVVAPTKAALVRARSLWWTLSHRGNAPTGTGMRFLCYHRISDNPDDLAVRPHRFREQMDYLASQGYRVLDVVQAFELLEEGQVVPARTIALSFDDGYRDIAEHALPVLAERGFAAAVFVVTGATDGVTRLPWYRQQPRLLDWDEITSLDGQGVLRFEAHSVTHPNLTLLSVGAAEAEIRDSKRILEERLGRRIEAFCYPRGRFARREEDLVRKAGFRLAVSVNPGLNQPGMNRFALRRHSIERRDSMLDFRVKLEGGHDSFLFLQRTYRKVR